MMVVGARCNCTAERASAHLLAADKSSSGRIVSPIVKMAIVSKLIADLSLQNGQASARNNALQQGGYNHE
jgi:hypothetical protein